MADRDRLDALTGVLIRDLDARRTVLDAAWLEANDVTADRFLASNRATVVTVYLQEKNIVDPARLVSVGYGEWRPVSDNDDAEGRAQNRRVELIVTGLELDNSAGDEIQQYYTQRQSAGIPDDLAETLDGGESS